MCILLHFSRTEIASKTVQGRMVTLLKTAASKTYIHSIGLGRGSVLWLRKCTNSFQLKRPLKTNELHSLPMFSTSPACLFWSPERHLASPSLTFAPILCLFENSGPKKWGRFF